MSVHSPTPRLGRALALGTAAAFGLGSLFAAPAFAEPAPSDAPTTGPTYETTSLEILSDESVEAVGRDADGNVVILTSAQSDAADAYAAEHDNVVIKSIGSGFKALATTDVVGGAGYLSPLEGTNSVGLCSVGFSGWTPAGDPAVITAGHCTEDGALTETYLTVPSGDDAAGGTQIAVQSPLGEFGFSQYGGENNTPGTFGDPASVDIAVMDVTNPALDLLPQVTDWSNTTDLSASTTEISAVGAFDASKPVSKSGRTTGLTTGVGAAPTGGIEDGWAEVGDRVVKGFGLELRVSSGDSGGAVFQGETAVGVVSGGNEEETYTWAADLQAGLDRTGGYTVMLAVDAPVLTSPAAGSEVQRGAAITGTSPAGTTVVVSPAGGEEFNATSDAAGNWSFPAPNALGDYSFSVRAESGFNVSGESGYTLEVVPAPLVAPVITNPTDGAIIETEVTTISGTGLPGATITVTGDVEDTVVIGDNGVWTLPVDLGYGEYSISVTQSSEGETSPVATSDFVVAPIAPTISTPADGSNFAADAAPTSTSGVGIEGATVNVSVNGTEIGTVDIEGPVPADATQLVAAAALPGDNWELALGTSIVTGTNVISVTQTVDGITSAAATSTITLAAVAGNPGGNGNGGGDGLAVTGGPDLLPIGLAAWLLIAGGLAAAVIVRKRRLGTEA